MSLPALARDSPWPPLAKAMNRDYRLTQAAITLNSNLLQSFLSARKSVAKDNVAACQP